MKKGDIVLVPFPFTDLKGSKNRPALVLINGKMDVTVSFISTQLHLHVATDVLLKPNTENGLKKNSLLRIEKIATIDKLLVLGILGKLDSKVISELDKKLIEILNINITET